jgi:hypothetical protein
MSDDVFIGRLAEVIGPQRAIAVLSKDGALYFSEEEAEPIYRIIEDTLNGPGTATLSEATRAALCKVLRCVLALRAQARRREERVHAARSRRRRAPASGRRGTMTT